MNNVFGNRLPATEMCESFISRIRFITYNQQNKFENIMPTRKIWITLHNDSYPNYLAFYYMNNPTSVKTSCQPVKLGEHKVWVWQVSVAIISQHKK